MNLIEPKFKLLVYDKKQFKDKDEANNNIALIKNRILDYPKECSIKEIAYYCTNGYPICFSYGIRNNRSSSKAYRDNNWREQQLIAIDIDNKDRQRYTTIDEAICLCKNNGITPSIVYTTLSSTDIINKYRIIFALRDSIKDKGLYLDVLNSLANILSVKGKTIIDTACKDLSRIFYPGKKIEYYDENAILDIDSILSFNKKNYITIKKESNNLRQKDNNSIKRSTILNYDLDTNMVLNALLETTKIVKMENEMVMSPIMTRVRDQLTKLGLLKPLYYRFKQSPFSVNLSKPITTRVPGFLFSILRTIPMDKLLNKPLNTSLPCFFHKDSHPSARIERDNTGRYIYHCYACQTKYDIIDLLCKLANVSILDVRNFLCILCNIEYETEWQSRMSYRIMQMQNYIYDKSFKEKYPLLDKTLTRKNLFPVYLMMLDCARTYLFDKYVSGANNPIFYLTKKQLVKRFHKYYDCKKNEQSLYKGIKYLARIGLIKILKDSDIPKSILDCLNKIKRDNMHNRRIECYSIPDFNSDMFYNAEKQIQSDKDNCVRMSHYCRTEAVLEDKKLANNIYVQDIDSEINHKINKFYVAYKARALKLLKTKKFFLEKNLLSYMKQYTSIQKEKYSNYCLPKLIKELRLKKVSFSKKIEKQYNITNKYIARHNMHYGVTKLYIERENEL